MSPEPALTRARRRRLHNLRRPNCRLRDPGRSPSRRSGLIEGVFDHQAGISLIHQALHHNHLLMDVIKAGACG